MVTRSELLSARVPRYTSYPTAPHFNAGVGGATVHGWLSDLPLDAPLSLYFHIPFCDRLCWFCGCHTRVVNSYVPIAAYVDVLLREFDMVGEVLGQGRPVTHIHFGGGSPTMLSPRDIARIAGAIRGRFDVRPSAEFAVEIDPRTLRADVVDAFAQAGVTRASLGVQDINPQVQRAVNRWQPMAQTREAVERLRDAGITALNVDLMYGLPHQTVDDVRRTIDEVQTLAPQRVAIFGYAHVPDMKRHQQLIDAATLPGGEERLQQYDAANAAMIAYGYAPIGLDHFARADDPMAVALRTGTLSRNFQGYTTDAAAALIGFGASAISAFPQGYAQNDTDAAGYRGKIRRGEPATVRGRAVTADDRVRRAIIERLMCDLAVDLSSIAADYDCGPNAFAVERERLAALQAEGLVDVDGYRLRIPDEARAGLRLVCAVFDSYLQPQAARHAAAV
ncbi:MAG: oxygen-independent coproporphyrinogen III oxidase [Alphaproteobacteria bacterium]|nr:oxygen-independent coproporphyrinogen III oxidase [Alphaproteobacteria bacterium]